MDSSIELRFVTGDSLPEIKAKALHEGRYALDTDVKIARVGDRYGLDAGILKEVAWAPYTENKSVSGPLKRRAGSDKYYVTAILVVPSIADTHNEQADD